MAGVRLWVKKEWARRWAGLVGLGLVIALVGGVTLAVAAGARRTATAFARFERSTNAPQVQVDIRQPDSEQDLSFEGVPTADQLADTIAAVDGVRGVTVLSFLAASPTADGVYFASALGAMRGEAPTSRLVAGREPAADAPDEVLLNEAALDQWDVSLGETFDLHTLAPDQMPTFLGLNRDPARGPVIPVQVVGVIRGVEDISDFPEPLFLGGAAFIERWGSQLADVVGTALVKVDPARVDAVAATVGAATEEHFETSLLADGDNFGRRVADTVDVEVTVLAIFAAAAALAGLVVVVQALSRALGGSAGDERTLAALGLTERQSTLAMAAVLLPALAVGLVGSLGLGVALSPLFPRGLARLAEPDPGVRIEPPVLLLGGALLLVGLLAVAALASWRAVRRAALPVTTRASGQGIVSRITEALPPAPALGTRFALERERRRGVLSGSAGMVGAALLVGGLVAIAVVESSRHELLTNGRLYGAAWDLEVTLDGLDPGPVISALAAEPDVAGLATRSRLLYNNGELTVHGPGGESTGLPRAYATQKGSILPVVSVGRPPGSGEAAIGTELAHRLGASMGDTIVADGPGGNVALRVTGWLVDPSQDELDVGMAVTGDTLDRLKRGGCAPDSEEYACYVAVEGAGIDVRDGVSVDAVRDRLEAIAPELRVPPRPSIVDNLSEVGDTPWFLALFLALIGGSGLAHSLIVGVRRRRRDLAVVRTMGLRPAQARQVVRWQALVMGGLGAALGLVLGVVVGRLVWKRVVEGVGALVWIDVPPGVLVVAPLVAFGVALLLAVVTGRRASGLQPARVLRAE